MVVIRVVNGGLNMEKKLRISEKEVKYHSIKLEDDLKNMSEMEKDVIYSLFGFKGKCKKTVEDLSEELGITPNTIRIILDRYLQKSGLLVAKRRKIQHEKYKEFFNE